ncbi:MAG: terminase [Lachnospiraceae bacterium]|nr:terminase [Lachnospiraceae bacterium]
MGDVQGNRYLSGTYAEVYYNGLKVLGCTKISIKITVNREDVQTGLDVDTKIVGLKGEGTISVTRCYSAFEEVRKEIAAGRDPRGTIVTKLEDKDATGGQIERYQIGNVALNEFCLEYEKGATVKSEIPFGFTPTDMINLDEIKR